MVSFTPLGLKSLAHDRLRSNGGNARQLILIHTGLTVLISLFSSCLHIFLDTQIGTTGGLSGLGTRSILQTIQTMLQYANALFSPFWAAGFLTVAMNWSADQRSYPKDLLHGFRRFRTILSYTFFSSAIYFSVMLTSAYIAALIFSFTPFAEPVQEILLAHSVSGQLDMNNLPWDQLAVSYIPYWILWLAFMIPGMIHFFYTLRMSLYLIIDHPEIGALRAMGASRFFIENRKMQLFKLDLSFWWYYLLEFILIIVCYLDLILPRLGIQLPFNETVGYFLFLALYGVLQLGLHVWKKPEIETTYALAYRFITHPDHLDPPESA